MFIHDSNMIFRCEKLILTLSFDRPGGQTGNEIFL